MSRIGRRLLGVITAACAVAGGGGVALAGPAVAHPAARHAAEPVMTPPPGTPGGDPGTFAYVKPSRIVDTRKDLGGEPAGPNGTTTVSVSGRGDIPLGVGGVAVNVTVVGSQSGYATVYPAGSPRPLASNVNFQKGVPASNDVIVRPGTDGKVTLYAYSRGRTQFIIDARGYYGGGIATAAGALVPTTPTRVLDTRRDLGAATPAANSRITVPVAGHAGVPSDASAVVMNLTATGSQYSGYLAVSPAGQNSGGTSALNFRADRSVPNLVTEPLGTNGAIAVLNASNGRTGVLADVLGYYRGGTPTTAGTFVPIAPKRVVDTARNLGLKPFGPNDRQVLGSAGVPSSADSVALNITIANETVSSYFTANSGSHLPPAISTVNYQRHVTIAHGTQNGTGHFDFYNRAGHVRAIVDVTGYFLRSDQGPDPDRDPNGGSITGQVTGASSGTLLVVQAYTPSGRPVTGVETDSGSGFHYSIPELPPAQYVVCVAEEAPEGQQTYQSECYDNQPYTGGTPPSSASPVTVTAGKATTVNFAITAK